MDLQKATMIFIVCYYLFFMIAWDLSCILGKRWHERGVFPAIVRDTRRDARRFFLVFHSAIKHLVRAD